MMVPGFDERMIPSIQRIDYYHLLTTKVNIDTNAIKTDSLWEFPSSSILPSIFSVALRSFHQLLLSNIKDLQNGHLSIHHSPEFLIFLTESLCSSFLPGFHPTIFTVISWNIRHERKIGSSEEMILLAKIASLIRYIRVISLHGNIELRAYPLRIYPSLQAIEIYDSSSIEFIKEIQLFYNQLNVMILHNIPQMDITFFTKVTWHTVHHLSLTACGISNTIYEILPYFPVLQHLDLSKNRLTIGDLTLLQTITYVNLSKNSIRILSCAKGEREQKLERLELNHNYITSIPNLAELKRLTYLGLANNRIEKSCNFLPALRQLVNLEGLKIKGNPFCRCPDYRREILYWLGTRITLDNVWWTEAEVLCVGYPENQHITENAFEPFPLDYKHSFASLPLTTPLWYPSIRKTKKPMRIARFQRLSNIGANYKRLSSNNVNDQKERVSEKELLVIPTIHCEIEKRTAMHLRLSAHQIEWNEEIFMLRDLRTISFRQVSDAVVGIGLYLSFWINDREFSHCYEFHQMESFQSFLILLYDILFANLSVSTVCFWLCKQCLALSHGFSSPDDEPFLCPACQSGNVRIIQELNAEVALVNMGIQVASKLHKVIKEQETCMETSTTESTYVYHPTSIEDTTSENFRNEFIIRLEPRS